MNPKFASDAAAQFWTSPAAYGSRSTSLKYFDSGIAIHNVQNSVQPGRIIELSPFKLDVFETALKHCKDLRTELVQKQNYNATQLVGFAERIRTKFEVFKGSVLADLTSPTTAALEAELKLGETYSEWVFRATVTGHSGGS